MTGDRPWRGKGHARIKISRRGGDENGCWIRSTSVVLAGTRMYRGRELRRQISVGVAVGSGIGATVLAILAMVFRRPSGWVGGDFEAATVYLAISLAIGTAVALLVIALAVLLPRQLPVVELASALLAGTTAATAFAFLAQPVHEAAASISGPGAYTVLELSRLSWVLYTIAAFALLAAAVDPEPIGSRGGGWRTVGVVGLVIGMTVILAGGAMIGSSRTALVRAEPIAVAATPTSIADTEAYRLRSATPGLVVPAGPGFVTFDSSGVRAYDGASGESRWHYPRDRFPEGCTGDGVWSTGTSVDSVVMVQCSRENEADDDTPHPVVSGFDAMTGRHLWTNAEGWVVRARSVSDGDGAVGVSRSDGDAERVGALDVRTGRLRWQQAATECTDVESATTTTSSVVVVELCQGDKRTAAISYDLDSGSSQRMPIELPRWSGADAAIHFDVVAASGPQMAIRYTLDRSGHEEALAIVDTSSATVRIDWGQFDWFVTAPEAGLISGNVTQIRSHTGDDATYVLSMPSDEHRRIDRLDIFTAWQGASLNAWRWAAIGDQLVTATDRDDDGFRLVVVNDDGSFERRASPCGADPGGVIPVPGAVLVVCPRERYENKSLGYEIIALR
ncbi:PQQ-binding-like beta-propeller repeat protein [Gordonia sp. PKS22-38]|uniref:PQQ-binding-like beta-propeller repeat protein n=1 Tax=Gordonia prachuapensis TaxID=3115651 RepID=A0ABU7MP56_9ACTN|nr:PQQ-binding-like beta-propeller repeat protein [Gordonia sp. PKS22-38]